MEIGAIYRSVKITKRAALCGTQFPSQSDVNELARGSLGRLPAQVKANAFAMQVRSEVACDAISWYVDNPEQRDGSCLMFYYKDVGPEVEFILNLKDCNEFMGKRDTSYSTYLRPLKVVPEFVTVQVIDVPDYSSLVQAIVRDFVLIRRVNCVTVHPSLLHVNVHAKRLGLVARKRPLSVKRTQFKGWRARRSRQSNHVYPGEVLVTSNVVKEFLPRFSQHWLLPEGAFAVDEDEFRRQCIENFTAKRARLRDKDNVNSDDIVPIRGFTQVKKCWPP